MRGKSYFSKIALAVFALASTLAAQSQKQPSVQPTPQKQSSAPQPAPSQISLKQVEELKTEISSLVSRVSEAETAAAKLAGRVFRLELNQSSHQSISLDLTSRNFQRLDSDTGMFLISVQDASPYLDGYKVSLNVGNPSSASYDGFKLKVKWNKKYDWEKFTAESYEDWDKSTRVKEVSFTSSLIPGKWNRVELLLPSTSGDQLSYLEISLETDEISLAKER